ncbi:MAG: hypothetical protein LUE14_11340, partial [Clostridiales bacterium]|nr:hypothetical protein [Clostridiales bacterium]
MKSLTEIQKDIRSLEKNISEMAASVKQIHSDLDNLKTSGRNEPVDYAAIQTLAKFMPFTGHPIDRMRDERACKLYLELLLNVARMNSEQMISADQLVFIQWILMQSKLDLSLEELLTDCYRMDTDSYDEMAEAIPIDSRGMLIIDTLIVAGCNTTFNGDACQYITDAAVLFGITKTEMILFANVAKAALCQNINHIKKEDFDDFITNVEPYGYYVKQ